MGTRHPQRAATRPAARAAWAPWIIWPLALIGVAGLLVTLRTQLDKAHVALAFLMVVLGGSAAAGRRLGTTLAVFAFFLFNFFFLVPYHTLVVTHPLDWLVLAAFLFTGIVAAQLLNRAQERAETARRRAVEVERLAALGSEALNAGRAEDAVKSVLEVIRTAMRVDCCEILMPRGAQVLPGARMRVGACADDGGSEGHESAAAWSLAAWVAEKRAVGAERADGTKWIGSAVSGTDGLLWPTPDTDMRNLFVPLQVRDRLVGVLSISDHQSFRLDPNQEQFLAALSYYAALGVERVGLVAEAERAEAFRQADALKSALIAGVSHDLRTPLTSIKALAQRLREQGSQEGASIEEEADRLNRLVADVLDLSRLNAGAMPLRVEFNTAEDLVGAAIRQIGATVRDRRIEVTSDRPPSPNGELPLLVGRFDFAQSLRALVNLLENADKYSPASAPIEIRVGQRGSALEFAVEDRGLGVTDRERERIFEPFYRAPGAPADVGGAGLGLAIARRLAAEQGGSVRYEPRPGGGSVFVLALPAANGAVPIDGGHTES